MAGVYLDPLNPQSKYASIFLELFRQVIEDRSYVERLARHYAMFKDSLARPRKSSVGRTAASEIYQLKIRLRGAKPPIWRRVQVTGNISLARLHEVIQAAMGWHNCHLHEFKINGVAYSASRVEGEDLDQADASRYRLNQVAPQPKGKFRYQYDFGDDWEHEILIERIGPREADAVYPRCVGGARACPPEDCGGCGVMRISSEPSPIPLTSSTKRRKHGSAAAGTRPALINLKRLLHEETKAWIGGRWDPEAFDVERVNARLQSVFRSTGKRR